MGCIDEDKILGIFDSFVKKDASSALKIVDSVLNEGKTCGEFIDQLLSRIRDLLIFSSCGQEAKWIEFNTSLVERYGKSFSSDTLMYMVQILSDTRMRTTDSLLQRILLEMAIIKLCRMESVGSLKEIMEMIISLESRLGLLDSEPAGKTEDIAYTQESVTQQIVSETKEEYHTTKNDDKDLEAPFDEKSVWEKILIAIQSKKKIYLGAIKGGTACRVQGWRNYHRAS